MSSASKAFTSAGVAPWSFRVDATAWNGFHGFHVPGASGSVRDCDHAGPLIAHAANAKTSTAEWRRLECVRIIAIVEVCERAMIMSERPYG
jgi:hypothetical protein